MHTHRIDTPSPAGRDRDDAGRARNARPRDALGRPLPHGADGVPRIPDDAQFSADEGITFAQQLLDDGYAFAAHDVFEALWKASAPDEQRLWRGLAQIAVGLTHVQRGNIAGAVALLRRGADAIEAGTTRHGVDIDGIVARVRSIAADVEADRVPDPHEWRLGLRGKNDG